MTERVGRVHGRQRLFDREQGIRATAQRGVAQPLPARRCRDGACRCVLGSEIAPAGKTAGRLGSGELVERQPLRAVHHQLDAGAVRNLEAPTDLHASSS